MAGKNTLLSVPLFLFLLFFLLAGIYNRYASDDFEFLFRYHDLGLRGSVAYFYENWNTRWLAISFMNLVFSITSTVHTLLWYHILSVDLLWFAFYRIVRNITQRGTVDSLLLSGFAVIAFFYSCFSISDVFFWINTSTMYLWSVIALALIAGELMSEQRTVPGYMLIIFSAAYIGGSCEPLAAVTMVTIVTLFIYTLRYNFNSINRDNMLLKCALAFLFITATFTISMSGDGHLVRSSFLPVVSPGIKSWILVKSFIKMIFFYLPSKLMICLLFSFPWMLLGLTSSVTKINGRILRLSTIAFIALVILSLAPVVFVMSEMGPERSWTQISFYLTAYCSLLAFYAGTAMSKRLNPESALKIYAGIATLYILATALPAAIKNYQYRKSYDERMFVIDEAKTAEQKTTVIALEPLKEPGWYHSAEISADPYYFTNVHLKRYLGLDFNVKVNQ